MRDTQWWSPIYILTKSPWPVRPVCAYQSAQSVNFGRQHMPPFFGDACILKNKHLDQNCLRTMENMHRPYFVLRVINSISRILLLLQADDETTCLGLHTCFMVADLVGITSACCSMDSFLRIRCSLLFWVWDKPEGHHLGCRYFESYFMSFSHSLLQLMSFLTRLSLIGLCEAQLGYIVG